MAVVRNIIGAFEDIGEKIGQEVVSVPKDIAGTALESLGASSGNKQSTKTTTAKAPQTPDTGALGRLGNTDNTELKKVIARNALVQLAGRPQNQTESMFDKNKKEEEQKKILDKKQKEFSKMSELPTVASKAKRGNLYGLKQKKAAAERREGKSD